jgi:hypothetical protein
MKLNRFGLAALVATAVMLPALPAVTQGGYPIERPGTSVDDPALGRDLTGRSVKCRRVRIVHTTVPSLEGGSAYLLFRDPWLGYARGRELFLREFTTEDGVFGESGQPAGPVLDDGVTRQASRDHVSACGLCHNVPWRDAGAGATIAKNGGTGRNTPHLFGAGLIEMLGWQIRLDLMAVGDTNRDGFIGSQESAGKPAVVHNLPDGRPGRRSLDFGRFGDANGDGKPDLNSALHLWYVDRDGKRLPSTRSLNDRDVAGYSFEVQVFGFGQRSRLPVPSTIRGFAAMAFDVHAGLQAHDPTLNTEPKGDGLARVSLSGAPQFATAASRDRGRVVDAAFMSLVDTYRDGHVEELSEGDLDLIEWYQLNHPEPARGPNTAAVQRGEKLFAKIGCADCHTQDWYLPAANPTAADYTRRAGGDRRFYALDIKSAQVRPVGRVRLLARKQHGRWRRRFGAATVRGVYSDFRHHDLGTQCRQIQFDGSTITHFRTTPLWGAGSTAPYLHDGSALTLEAAILRHGGESAEVTRRYRALSAAEREAVSAFLRGLILYSTEDLPTDVDGDGSISRHFRVAGVDSGEERFNPEWLYQMPCRIEGPVVAPDGRRIRSDAIVNLNDSYGADLAYLRDTDGDGFPDLGTASVRR